MSIVKPLRAMSAPVAITNWIPGDRADGTWLRCIFASATKFYDFTPDVGEMFRIKMYLLYITIYECSSVRMMIFFLLLFQFYFVRKYGSAVYKVTLVWRRVALDQSAKTTNGTRVCQKQNIASAIQPYHYLCLQIFIFLRIGHCLFW